MTALEDCGTVNLLYRGELSSCNYDCSYCPFAKRRDPREVLERDRRDLARFVDWASSTSRSLAVLFTPWGEALTRDWYRSAVVELSHQPNVDRVAVQTNLSCSVDWLEEADRSTVALWCTYHPTEVTLDRFVAKCRTMTSMGVRYSAGIVGFAEHHDLAMRLREQLPNDVYLWVNQPEDQKGRMRADEIAAWKRIDPLFEQNTVAHQSLGQRCQAGESALSVAGNGDVRPCHFVDRRLGNLYVDDLDEILAPSTCPNDTCDCHIGYVHLDRLQLRRVYGDGLLERIPAVHLW